MNSILSNILEADTPKFGTTLINGADLDNAAEYMHHIIKSAMKGADANLKYLGWKRPTPVEEYNSIYKKNSTNLPIYDTSSSNLYKVTLFFTYKDVALRPIQIFLPYTEKGGILRISGNKYQMMYVLSDTVISPSDRDIFVRLLRDKIRIERINKNIVKNDMVISGNIIFSDIYSNNNKPNTKTRIVSGLGIYILGKRGYDETFRRYNNGIVPIITIGNVDKYKDTHDIYRSIKIKPKGYTSEDTYIGHDIKILVDKEIPLTVAAENIIHNIIYTLDYFPDRANELVRLIESPDNLDVEISSWRLILAQIIFKGQYSLDKIIREIKAHYQSLDSYMDDLIKEKLYEIGIVVEDFYDLLAELLDKFAITLMNAKEYNTDIYSKYYDVHYYVLYGLIVGVNKAIFEITRKAKNKVLSMPEVNNVFMNAIRPKEVYNIVKATGGANLTMSQLDYSGDTMYPKVAAKELQSRGITVKKNKRNTFPRENEVMSGTDVIVGSMYYLPKKAPTALLRHNAFLEVDKRTGRMIVPDEVKKVGTILNLILRGKFEDGAEVDVGDITGLEIDI